MSRIQLLEDALQNVQAYTKHSDGWRPGLVDLSVYNALMNMYEEDAEDEANVEYIWFDTPDHIMEKIMLSGRIFDLEYGFEDLYEALREYLVQQDFIKHVDDIEEEE